MAIDPRALLQDYEKTEAMLAACRATMRSLMRHRRLVVGALDELTKPDSVEPQGTDSSKSENSRGLICGFRYRRERVDTRFAVESYCQIIAKLWADFPDRRPAIRAALNWSSNARFAMADTPEKLYPGRDATWRRGKYEKLCEEVFVDTNLSNAQKEQKLRAAVSAAGLTWGSDVEVYGF